MNRLLAVAVWLCLGIGNARTAEVIMRETDQQSERALEYWTKEQKSE
jgi:hypothetical protein